MLKSEIDRSSVRQLVPVWFAISLGLGGLGLGVSMGAYATGLPSDESMAERDRTTPVSWTEPFRTSIDELLLRLERAVFSLEPAAFDQPFDATVPRLLLSVEPLTFEPVCMAPQVFIRRYDVGLY